MFNYFTYKFLHFTFIILFLSGMSATFFQKENMRWIKVFYSAMAVLALITGIMLSMRIGVSHKGTWPIWIKLKILLWFVITVGMPIANKLFNFGRWLFWVQIPFILLLIYCAIFKPL